MEVVCSFQPPNISVRNFILMFERVLNTPLMLLFFLFYQILSSLYFFILFSPQYLSWMYNWGGLLMDHSLIMYAKCSEKLTILNSWCAYQEVRNVSFSENFAYLLNDWFLTLLMVLFFLRCLLVWMFLFMIYIHDSQMIQNKNMIRIFAHVPKKLPWKETATLPSWASLHF